MVSTMCTATLGRTNLRVSVMGLGCGGHSRLGLGVGKSEEDAVALVKAALDLGINFIDTAESYKTETAVGKGIKGVPRDQVYISTKSEVGAGDRFATAKEYQERVEGCLKRLDTDYIDLMNLHGVSVEEYAHGRDMLVPELKKMQEEGKVRFIGITEQFIVDPTHQTLKMALKDDCWDVMMVGFNLLNPSARRSVFPETQRQNIGTQGMFAVRRALSRPAALNELMHELVADGVIEAGSFDPENPLGFLVEDGVAESVQDAAYRFCRWEPGMDLVLSGTSDVEHLKANAASLNRGPLPFEVTERLRKLFGNVDSVSGN